MNEEDEKRVQMLRAQIHEAEYTIQERWSDIFDAQEDIKQARRIILAWEEEVARISSNKDQS